MRARLSIILLTLALVACAAEQPKEDSAGDMCIVQNAAISKLLMQGRKLTQELNDAEDEADEANKRYLDCRAGRST